MAVTAFGSGTWTDLKASTFTVTIASPGVFTLNSHGLVAGDKIVFQTTGALPTGLTAGTTYFVISAGLTTNAFEVSTSDGGSAVNTSGSQSGTHSVTSVEHIVADINQAGTYTLHVDKINLASADVLETRSYQMILTGGTRRVAYYGRFDNAQPADDLIAISVPISNELTDTGALRYTLKQPFGTGRAYPWKVLRYA
jgi:hypothetical protein